MAKGPKVAPACRPNWRQEFKQRGLPPIVRVTWLDACSWNGPLKPVDGWRKQISTGSLQQTVGYRMAQDEEFVTLAQDISCQEQTVRHLYEVPMVNVLEIKEIR